MAERTDGHAEAPNRRPRAQKLGNRKRDATSLRGSSPLSAASAATERRRSEAGLAPGRITKGKGYAESTEQNDGVCSPCFPDCESAMVGTRREAGLSCMGEKLMVLVFGSCADRRLRVKPVRCCPVLPCQNVWDQIPLTGAGVIPVGIKEGFFRQRVVPARGSRPKRVLVRSLPDDCALDGGSSRAPQPRIYRAALWVQLGGVEMGGQWPRVLDLWIKPRGLVAR